VQFFSGYTVISGYLKGWNGAVP